jgi:hypothetical protein
MTRHCVTCVELKVEKPKRSTFGEIGKSPMYCKKHMKEDMIDMKNDRCHCGKGKPSFNIEGEVPLYCAECKGEDMINVCSKMCIECKKSKPSFNTPGKAPDYCGKCVKKLKLPNMVNVNNKKCAHIENGKRCGHNPKFNLPGQKGGLYCNKHKPDDRYVNVINK